MSITTGHRIRLYRQSANMSQSELGEKLNLSKGTVYNWEKGISNPNDYNISCLARIFGVKPEDLTEEDVDEKNVATNIKFKDKPFLRANALTNELIGFFAGGELSDSDLEALMLTLQSAYVACKSKTIKFPDKGADND